MRKITLWPTLSFVLRILTVLWTLQHQLIRVDGWLPCFVMTLTWRSSVLCPLSHARQTQARKQKLGYWDTALCYNYVATSIVLTQAYVRLQRGDWHISHCAFCKYECNFMVKSATPTQGFECFPKSIFLHPFQACCLLGLIRALEKNVAKCSSAFHRDTKVSVCTSAQHS